MDQELKSYLELQFAQTENARAAMEPRLISEIRLSEDRLTERMRDMQTELLRGFEAFAAGQTIRLRKLEADHSNLDASVTGRMDVLETRLRQIEQRLGLSS